MYHKAASVAILAQMWRGRPVLGVPDSSSESPTVPATDTELAAMGRGPCWQQAEWDVLMAGIAAGDTCAKMARDNHWPYSSVIKAMRRAKAGHATPWRPGPGRGKAVDAETLAAAEKHLEDAGGKTSIKRLAAALGRPRTTAHQILRGHLGKISFKQVRGQKLSGVQRDRRLAWARRLRLGLRTKPIRLDGVKVPTLNIDRIAWTDEKLFTCIDKRQQHCWVDRETADGAAVRKRDLPAEEIVNPQPRRYAASVMVSLGCTTAGIWEPFFIDRGVKLNTEKYVELVTSYILPRCMAEFETGADAGQPWLLQQDSAPSHVSKRALLFFRENNVALLDWAPNSPDCQPLDFSLWKLIDDEVQKQAPQTDIQLRACISRACRQIPVETVKAAIQSIPRRLLKCEEAKGGHFEYKL